MASLTNAYTAGIGLPDGRLIPPGGSVDKVDAATLKHPVVAARIEAKQLVLEGDAPPAKKPLVIADFDNATDDDLRTYLGDREVKVDGRWNRERLLSEAKKVKA